MKSYINNSNLVRDFIIFVCIYLLIATLFLLRISPIKSTVFFWGGGPCNYNSSLNPNLNLLIKGFERYGSKIIFGITTNNEPNSIGNALLFYPPYALHLKTVYSFLYYFLVITILVSLGIFIAYLFFDRNLLSILLLVLYWPINNLMFATYSTFLGFLALVLNLYLYKKGKHLLSYFVLGLSALNRPEMFFILLIEMFLEWKTKGIHNRKLADQTLFFVKRFTPILFYLILFMIPQYIVYGNPIAQFSFNITKKWNFDLESLISTFLVFGIELISILLLLFSKFKYSSKNKIFIDLFTYIAIFYLLFTVTFLLLKSYSFPWFFRIISGGMSVVLTKAILDFLKQNYNIYPHIKN